MTILFNSAPGSAVAIPGTTAAAPFKITIEGWSGSGGSSFAQYSAITTGVQIAHAGNYQFLHTLRNFIYVYIFGERMGSFTVNGITFNGQCPSGGQDGVSGVLNYYKQKNIVATGEPVSVQIGASSFRAFLIAANANMSKPELGIGTFKMSFSIVPPDDSGGTA